MPGAINKNHTLVLSLKKIPKNTLIFKKLFFNNKIIGCQITEIIFMKMWKEYSKIKKLIKSRTTDMKKNPY